MSEESRTHRILTKNLSKLRENSMYTLMQVAEFLGKPESSAWRYENGKQWPSPEVLDKFADLYKLKVSDLFRPGAFADKAYANESTEGNKVAQVEGMIAEGKVDLFMRVVNGKHEIDLKYKGGA